ncbi:Binding partner of ACD11 1 [Quillaja saponaria]|uniref:Binding partner of ACD11 1 n=1 Tax=Quillaja saponaria TaxID=32244 RepID=A0AAD7L9A3_QUISA|nr:Binding partner of ACD11 1 [Quillaja saponaria]
MTPGGYTVEVTSLSPKATEKDVNDFFAFSGAIEHVEIVRSGDYACTAYVTFKDAYSQETACLLSGATIVDERVCITRWGHYDEEFDFWKSPSYRHEEDAGPNQSPQSSPFVSTAGEAVTIAQEVVKSMLEKGYILGKDALTRAKTYDESHQVSATAAAKVAELSQRIGLADKFSAGVEAVKSVDEKYHVSEMTKSAASATGRTVAAAANSVANSSYFSKGALWVSDALTRAAKAAADLGSHGIKQ